MNLAKELLEAGLIDADKLQRAENLTSKSDRTLCRILLDLGLVADEDLVALLSEKLHLPRIDGDALRTVVALGFDLNPRFLKHRALVSFEMDANTVGLAMSDPTDESARQAVEFATGRRVLSMVARRSDIQATLERLYPSINTVAAEAGNYHGRDLALLQEASSDAPAIRYFNDILKEAVKRQASDIHLEHDQNDIRVRLRLDGVLVAHDRLTVLLGEALLRRIKVMSGMDIAERRLPQDGRMSITVSGKDIDCRVSSAPSVAGENIVLRLLPRRRSRPLLCELGFRPNDQAALEDALRRPEGLVLVTGPTGSGKTTSLYAALAKVDSGRVKIATVEDPVEYWLDGTTQVEVNAAIGRTFAATLRAFLRQDPDVILVGEVRDEETARIAVQAALTGHLVLSTLHTSRAAAAITRLLDMGVEDYLLASTLVAVVAQRLVRVFCKECRGRQAEANGGLLSNRKESPGVCECCGGGGFSGRTAIAEVLIVDDAIRSHIRNRSSESEIERSAIARGMITMRENGMRAVTERLTSLDELNRVTSVGYQ